MNRLTLRSILFSSFSGILLFSLIPGSLHSQIPDSLQVDTTRTPVFELRGLTILVPRPVSTTGGASAVEVALGIASVVYGGLLGAFALGILAERADQASTMMGMATGIGVVRVIWLLIPDQVAWPWFVLIGTSVTFGVGWALGRRRLA